MHHDLAGVAQPEGEIAWSIEGEERPAVDNHDAVTGQAHLGQNVGGEDHGAPAVHGADQAAKLRGLVWVQADGGFIQDQHGRIME